MPRPWRIMLKRMAYYAILLCSKHYIHVIMLPVPDRFWPHGTMPGVGHMTRSKVTFA